MAKLRQAAIYGKGGIGKSTTTQNLVAALAEAKVQLPREHIARDDASRLALTVKLLMDGEVGLPAA